MERRALLRAVGVAGAVGLSGTSGCVGSLADVAGGGDVTEWHHDVGGSVDAVADGRVFGREYVHGDQDDGVVYALDAATGEREWTEGGAGALSRYTDLAVDDALYFGFGTDGGGGGALYAVEFDGEERWTRELDGSVYYPPRVVDSVAYAVVGHAAVAFDTDDGSTLWWTDLREFPRGVAVTDAVYAAADDLVSLDLADGSERWRYDLGDEHAYDSFVGDNAAYVSTSERLAAVDDGDERWSVDAGGAIHGLADGSLLVTDDHRAHAYDVATGEREWRSDPVGSGDAAGPAASAVGGDSLYLGLDRVAAVAVGDGRERWSADLDDGEELSDLRAAADGEQSMYAAVGDRIVGFGADGEQSWRRTLAEDVADVLVDDRVYASTRGDVYAFDPSKATPTE